MNAYCAPRNKVFPLLLLCLPARVLRFTAVWEHTIHGLENYARCSTETTTELMVALDMGAGSIVNVARIRHG